LFLTNDQNQRWRAKRQKEERKKRPPAIRCIVC